MARVATHSPRAAQRKRGIACVTAGRDRPEASITSISTSRCCGPVNCWKALPSTPSFFIARAIDSSRVSPRR